MIKRDTSVIPFPTLMDISKWYKTIFDSIHSFLKELEKRVGIIEYIPYQKNGLWFNNSKYAFAIKYFRGGGLSLVLVKQETPESRQYIQLTRDDIWVLLEGDIKENISCLVNFLDSFLTFLKHKEEELQRDMHEDNFLTLIYKSPLIRDIIFNREYPNR